MDTITDNTSGMKPQSTPGPWVMNEPANPYCDAEMMAADGRIIMEINRDDTEDGEFAANLKLIAAAPEMYTALQVILVAQWHPDPAVRQAAVAAANAAIRKADGRL